MLNWKLFWRVRYGKTDFMSKSIDYLKQYSYLKCSYLSLFRRRALLRSLAHDFHYSIEKRFFCHIHVLYIELLSGVFQKGKPPPFSRFHFKGIASKFRSVWYCSINKIFVHWGCEKSSRLGFNFHVGSCLQPKTFLTLSIIWLFF